MNTWDEVAGGYDEVADSALGRVLRDRVHELVAPLVSKETTAVDLGCGTGIDAAWMAGRGATVTAVDGSVEMVRIASSKLVPPSQAMVHDIESQDPIYVVAGEVDVVLSNFGVVNCVRDLALLGQKLAALLRPGGTAVIVSMAKYCPTELFECVVRRDLDRARRRLGSGAVVAEAPLDMEVRYHSARDLEKEFGPALVLQGSWAIGTVLPTFEQRRYLESRPRLLRALDGVDRLVARSSSRLGIGDHQVAMFERGS